MNNPVDDSKKAMSRGRKQLPFGLMLGGTLGDTIRWHLLEPYNPETVRRDRLVHRLNVHDDTLGFRVVRSKQ